MWMRCGTVILAAWIVSSVVAVRAVDPVRSVDAASSPGETVSSAESAQALVKTYCTGCHNQRSHSGGLALDDAALLSDMSGHAEQWETVLVKLKAGLMPPAGARRPDEAAIESFTSWVAGELDRAWAARPNPGRTEPLHRLNRFEYRNAIQDLLGIEADVSDLPADEISYGFDNIAGVLKLSPLLTERYLSSAQRIARIATGTPSPPGGLMVRVPDQLDQDVRLEGMPVGTRGGTAVHYMAPRDGKYVIKARLGRGLDEDIPHFRGDQHLEISIDGERVTLFTLKATDDWDLNVERQVWRGPSAGRQTGTARVGGDLPEDEALARRDLDSDWVVEVPLTAGPHMIRAAFLAKSPAALAEGFRRPFERPYIGRGVSDIRETREGAALRTLEIMGPLEAGGATASPFRSRVFVCEPSAAADEPDCAREILSALAKRAYRRAVSGADLDPLLEVYSKARADGATFDQGVEVALQRILVSPSFLFRIELEPAERNPETPDTYRISDVDLASRLSFFLWASVPDDELLDLAIAGRLHDPAVLEAQVSRMLADTRADRFMNNFVGQWWYLRNLPDMKPDPMIYPNFGDTLAEALWREAELFFQTVVRDDRPALELLTADYTFVNERLATHYGIPNVRGIAFRRVTLPPDSPRLGLLGKGAIWAVTAFPNRTSPVVRGKWVLENLLGAPPPAPPPVVPAFPEEQNIRKLLTIREKTELHRQNPMCASCHKLMDPIGFALENFDVTGKYRTYDEEFLPIDSADVYADGSRMDGVAGVRNLLLKRSDRFIENFVVKLMTYALGRGVEFYDMPSVRRVLDESEAGGHRLQSIIRGIVTSAPFQMRRTES